MLDAEENWSYGNDKIQTVQAQLADPAMILSLSGLELYLTYRIMCTYSSYYIIILKKNNKTVKHPRVKDMLFCHDVPEESRWSAAGAILFSANWSLQHDVGTGLLSDLFGALVIHVKTP